MRAAAQPVRAGLRPAVHRLGEACGYALAFIFTAVFVAAVPALIGLALWRSL